MANLTNSDTIAIIAITGIFIFCGMLLGAKAINSETFMMVALGVGAFLLMKFSVPLMIATLIKKIYGKGIAAQWNEVKKEIKDAAKQYEAMYDLMLPKYYMPKHAMPLPKYDFVLFEISRDDLLANGGEDIKSLSHEYPNLTIIFKPSNNSIAGEFRGNLDQTTDWIEEHKESFSKTGKEILVPNLIREMSFGQGIEVNTPENKTQP